MIRSAFLRVLASALILGAGGARAQNSFMDNCAACHQPDGKGIEGAFPALAGNPFVKGDPAAVIGVVLKGRGGMPAFEADLEDEAIAGAISYVRGAWGNGANAVTAADVAAARQGPKPDANRPLQAH
jgi:cytochrome c6